MKVEMREVNKHWFIGKVNGAAFFGQSPGEVLAKANEWKSIEGVQSAPVIRQRPKLRLVV